MGRGTTTADSSAPDLKLAVPGVVGAWHHQPGTSLLIPQGEVTADEVYDQLVSRHYASSALPPLMLLIAHGQAQNGNTQLHRPELCYPSAGFRIEERGTLALPLPGGASIQARVLTGIAPGRTEQILYWTRVGRDFPDSAMAQRWSALRQTLAAGPPDGVLVRFSTIEEDVGRGLALLQRFARDLWAGSDADLRRLLWGTA
jgi:EpsI family protein